MIKVFFDHQKFSTQVYGGISRYFASLIDDIKVRVEYDYLLGVLYSNNHYIKNERQVLKNIVGDKLLNSKYGQRAYYVNNIYSKKILKGGQYDIFHPTYYDPYFVGLNKKPMVTTIHDMTYEKLPEYFWASDPLTYNKRISIERTDHIIAISNATKNDILLFTNTNPEKISVVYHGIDLASEMLFHPVKDLPKEYILFVGDRSGYKNFYLFIKAFASIREKYPDLHVVLTGGGSMGIADQEFLTRLKVQNQVVHVQATDYELNYLYKNALFFTYPSLYEGFGLPILEAFKAECAILLSDTECFREVAQDSAAFFYPNDLDHLIFKLEELIHSETLRKGLISKGLERVKAFSIQDCVDSTMELYKRLA
jgi:glycosyltransferase involved in cell wall biosynthesis